MNTVAGIDVGTQSTKVIIYEPQTRSIVAQAQASHEMISRDDGTREQEASWWTAAITQCFGSIPLEIRKSVKAIGVSGQQHGFVGLDADGNVLTPVKLWCDTSTAPECRELTRAAGGEKILLEKAGNLILPGYTAGKILWMKKHRPELFARLATVLLPHDYINFWLTGNRVMEAGDASGTGLLDIRKRTWSTWLCRLVDPDLVEKLPGLIRPDAPAGELAAARAEALGLPAGIPVSSGGGDNMMAAIGTGTVSPGTICMSLGTSGTLFGFSEKPVVDPHGNLAAFCSSTGGWLPLLCTMNCTVATELLRELFNLDITAFETMVAQTSAGAGGVVILPYFNGERVPNFPHGRGCIAGLTPDNFTKPNLLRAAMESAIYGLAVGLESFVSQGFAPAEIRMTGGGAKNSLWRRIAADVTGLPVQVPKTTEAAAFGAALQALWCSTNLAGKSLEIAEITEVHSCLEKTAQALPDKNARAAYGKSYDTFRSYVRSLHDMFS